MWVSTNPIELFIRYWLWRLYKSYKKCTAKPYYFLVIDTIVASDNPLTLRKNLLERMYKLIYKLKDVQTKWWQLITRLEMKN